MSIVEANPPLAEMTAVLAQTPAKLAGIIGNGDADRLRSRPQPDDWSAEIVGHLRDTEIADSHRLRLILAGDRPSSPGFDPSTMLGLPRLGLPETLVLFRALRGANVFLLRNIPDADWQRAGLHQEEGLETVARNVQRLVEHDLDHLRQIRQALAGEEAEAQRT